MKRKILILLVMVVVIMCFGCKKQTTCELCARYMKCRYFDDGYYCDDCYENLKEAQEMDEEYNRWN